MWYVFWMQARTCRRERELLRSCITAACCCRSGRPAHGATQPWGGVLALSIFLSAYGRTVVRLSEWEASSASTSWRRAPRRRRAGRGSLRGSGIGRAFTVVTLIPGVTMSSRKLDSVRAHQRADGRAERRPRAHQAQFRLQDSSTIMPVRQPAGCHGCDSLFLVAVTSAFLLGFGPSVPGSADLTAAGLGRRNQPTVYVRPVLGGVHETHSGLQAPRAPSAPERWTLCVAMRTSWRWWYSAVGTRTGELLAQTLARSSACATSR